jgi:ParB-like nuclease domain
MSNEPRVLVISNMEEGDETFDSDVGCWNVSRAQAACSAGRHRHYKFMVSDVFEACKMVEVDEQKVMAMKLDPGRLVKSEPVIFAEEHGAIWLIDGHHRVNAMYRLGLEELVAYVIEEKDAKPYQIWFNGQRVAPWQKKGGD